MVIRTKIIATLGPACGDDGTLARMVEAGCDCARINLSHGTDEQHTALHRAVRRVEQRRDTPLAVLADLCGPKIRVGPIAGGSVLLADGQEIALSRQPVLGQADRISTTLAELVDAATPGEPVLLDDGQIRLRVERRDDDSLRCRVERGGIIAAGKGVNLPETRLELSALTEKDRRDVDWIAARGVRDDGGIDYVGLSFVRRADDVKLLRALLDDRGSDAQIVAKIEKPEALDNIDAIIDAADAVMVARGDLGVEMDLPGVPVAQKRIARKCLAAGTPCIIATQMLETMTHAASPTRAEVSDVANAVLDHADAVMLSGETAVGDDPPRAVGVMNDVVAATQTYHDETYRAEPGGRGASAAGALADAVERVLHQADVAAVAVYTISGRTARLFAKRRLPRPILGLSPHRATLRRMALDYGVEPAEAPVVEHTREALALAGRLAVRYGLAKPGQTIAVVTGRPITESGTANTLVLHTVESP
ncbi:MAG: pyruvate kinase [Planctomycetota bacterium]